MGAAQMGLELVERGFYLPAFMIEGCQFFGRGVAGIENGGGKSIDGSAPSIPSRR
jgi:hypothetical protein